MTPERITIAVPFVRGIPYLQKALESVFAQSSPEWLLLLCDNCLDPRERELARAQLDKYADPRASFMQASRHLSMGANFNRCMDLAATDLVTILHADDELLVDYVAQMLRATREHPAASMVFCPARIIGPLGQPVFSFVDAVKHIFIPRTPGPVKLKGEKGLQALMAGNFIMAPTVCFRKSKLGNVRWSEALSMTLDLDLYSRSLISGQSIVGIRGAAQYAYRRHDNSATAQFNQSLYRFREEATTYNTIAQRARNTGWHTAAAVADRKLSVYVHLLLLGAADLVKGRLRAAAAKLRLLFKLGSSCMDGPPSSKAGLGEDD
jgi:glycosyltransferase involved in cell wall biosynthesis